MTAICSYNLNKYVAKQDLEIKMHFHENQATPLSLSTGEEIWLDISLSWSKEISCGYAPNMWMLSC